MIAVNYIKPNNKQYVYSFVPNKDYYVFLTREKNSYNKSKSNTKKISREK